MHSNNVHILKQIVGLSYEEEEEEEEEEEVTEKTKGNEQNYTDQHFYVLSSFSLHLSRRIYSKH